MAGDWATYGLVLHLLWYRFTRYLAKYYRHISSMVGNELRPIFAADQSHDIKFPLDAQKPNGRVERREVLPVRVWSVQRINPRRSAAAWSPCLAKLLRCNIEMANNGLRSMPR